MLETDFVLYIDHVVTPENKFQILKEASRHSMVVTGILVSIFSSVILGWICSPLILKYIDISKEIHMEITSEDIWKYYCYILWLPKQLSEPSMYEVMYIYQVLTVFISVSHYTCCNVILFFLMFHISTHFKLLVSSFENVGKVVPEGRYEMEEHIHRSGRLSLFMNHTINNGLNDDSCTTVSNSGKNAVPAEGTPCLLQQCQYPENFRSLAVDERSGTQTSEHGNADDVIGTAFDEQQMNDYLINCIKYHQAILE
jgi:hypothetical protein